MLAGLDVCYCEVLCATIIATPGVIVEVQPKR
jgi:hypothetical protein